MYHFIVNIHGASGKAYLVWKEIQSILKERNIQYRKHLSLGIGNSADIAREIASSEEDDKKIIILGGDGTINEVLNGLSESDFGKIKLGLIPTGSGNDFARGLNLPRKNPKKALELILDSKGDKKIDLGVIESDDENALFKRRLFGISSGFGLDAIVGTSINTSKIKKVLNFLKMGSLSYAILTVVTLFSMKTYDVKVKFDDEEPISFKKLIFLVAMNCFAEGGGVPMCPEAKVDDGKLSVCIVSGVPKFLTFFAFPILLMGKQKILKSFVLREFEKMEVESVSPTISATDGEMFGNIKKARYSVWKNVLSILC